MACQNCDTPNDYARTTLQTCTNHFAGGAVVWTTDGWRGCPVCCEVKSLEETIEQREAKIKRLEEALRDRKKPLDTDTDSG